jgi:integrase
MAKNNSLVDPTPEEMLRVLKVARQRSSRDWAMILLAYRDGMRASEVCGLEMPDLDLRNGSITIRRLKGSLNDCAAALSAPRDAIAG